MAAGWNNTQPPAMGSPKKRIGLFMWRGRKLFPSFKRLSPPLLLPWPQIDSPFRKKNLDPLMVSAFQRATRTRAGLGWLGVGSDRDLLPVPVFHSWVAGNAEDRDVLLEFINLDFHILC